MPLVTTVIPNYNYARYLPAAIDSVLGQTHQENEIIVIDDGSRDDSIEVLKRYGDRIRWIRQANQGVSAARNLGIREARGELIAVLDADDVWHPTKLEKQLLQFRDPAVGLVHCWVRHIDAEGRPIKLVKAGMRGWILGAHARLEPTMCSGGSGSLIRRSCFDRVGLFDTDLSTSADWDMWRRIMTAYRVELVEEPLVDYRIHAAAMHRNVPAFEHDMLRAFDTLYADPAAAEAWPSRRSAFARLYSQIAADYFLTGARDRALRYAVRSVALDPVPVAQILLRRAARTARSTLRRAIDGAGAS